MSGFSSNAICKYVIYNMQSDHLRQNIKHLGRSVLVPFRPQLCIEWILWGKTSIQILVTELDWSQMLYLDWGWADTEYQ